MYPWIVILVDVDARSWPGSVLTVLSDDAVDGAEAETLLTTDETMDKSTVDFCVSRRENATGPWDAPSGACSTYSFPAAHLISALSLSFR